MKKEDVLRHPADTEGWKHIDFEFSDFTLDPRNTHLGLALDGYNSFGHMSTSFNMCHVVLIS